MRIELLYFEGCPNYQSYHPHLRQLLDEAGIAEPIRLRVVASQEAAERERFLGSPTVRVDGRDVDPAAADRHDYGLQCRLYRSTAGLQGVPPDEWVRATLIR